MADESLNALLEVLTNPDLMKQRVKELQAAEAAAKRATAELDKAKAENTRAAADSNAMYQKASEERMAAKRALAEADRKLAAAQELVDRATIKEGEISQRETASNAREIKSMQEAEEVAAKSRALDERAAAVASQDVALGNLRKELESKLARLREIAA